MADADIAIASDQAWFVDTHVQVGQISGIEPASLALRMPITLISQLALAGRTGRIDAPRAAATGPISEVTTPERLLTGAHELADAIAAASPEAVRTTRSILRRLEAGVLRPAMEAEFTALVEHWSHPDCREWGLAWTEQ